MRNPVRSKKSFKVNFLMENENGRLVCQKSEIVESDTPKHAACQATKEQFSLSELRIDEEKHEEKLFCVVHVIHISDEWESITFFAHFR